MLAAESDDGLEGVAVTDAPFVTVNDVNRETDQNTLPVTTLVHEQ